jgi:hypothetical protein
MMFEHLPNETLIMITALDMRVARNDIVAPGVEKLYFGLAYIEMEMHLHVPGEPCILARGRGIAAIMFHEDYDYPIYQN